MELDNERPMRCRFCLRHFKYQHSLVLHLKENHLLKILEYQKYRYCATPPTDSGSDKSDYSYDRPSVIISNPYFRPHQ